MCIDNNKNKRIAPVERVINGTNFSEETDDKKIKDWIINQRKHLVYKTKHYVSNDLIIDPSW